MPVGATETIEYQVTVDSPIAGDGRLQNAATSPDPGARCTALGGCATDTPIRSVQVVKTSDPAPGAVLSVGDVVTYTITVVNTGEAPLTPSSFTDDLTNVLDDADLQGTPTASSGTVSYAAPILSWQGNLAVDATANVTYQIRIKAGGDRRLDNVVISDDPGSNCPEGSVEDDCFTESVVVIPPTTTLPPTTTTQPPGPLPSTGSGVIDSLLIAGLLMGAGLAVLGITRRRATSATGRKAS